METLHYFYNCSKEYISSIDPGLFDDITDIITLLPKRKNQAEINRDLYWALISKGWSYDKTPAHIEDTPPSDLKGISDKKITRDHNNRSLCRTSTTLEARWYADYAKQYGTKVVQLEAQFGKVELMFKDFCGFKIAYQERRLALGIELVLCEPSKYFAHRRASISGMAYFEIAKKTLPTIGFNCPIWLIGIEGS